MAPRKSGREKLSETEMADLLSRVDFLEPLSREAVAHLVQKVAYVHLERGQILHTPKHRGSALFLLLEGRMWIYKATPEKEFTLFVAAPGTVFGEMALSMERVQGAYARALEPSTVALISRNTLKSLVATNAEVGLKMIELLGERIAVYGDRLTDLAYRAVLARLAGLILRLAEAEGVVKTTGIEIPALYTHRQLGTMIGANRETVTNAFTQLREAGAVELSGRHIYVRDREALRSLAEER